jgi:tRNA dimethylallyltransferase
MLNSTVGPEMKNLVVVLGPTASGKTRLGVELARELGGEIVSADSRQVYRGLDIGAGKDLDEYSSGGSPVAYHLIDIVDLDSEFSVFEYQQRFFSVFEDLLARTVLPIVVGGSGLYLEAVLNGYRMVDVPADPVLRADLEPLSQEALVDRLQALRRVHNTTDLEDRDRLVRAIEQYSEQHEPEPGPEIRPVVLGVRWDREVLRGRIRKRLGERLEEGLIDEVQSLREAGVSWEKLSFLGLEYRSKTTSDRSSRRPSAASPSGRRRGFAGWSAGEPRFAGLKDAMWIKHFRSLRIVGG